MANLFAHHPRTWQTNRYVYPVISRRSQGLSIGINLNPSKACNFDCVYCCVDRTIPPTTRRVDLAVVAEELEHLLSLAQSGELFRHAPFDATPAPLRRLNDVAFSGDGEPTSYARFNDACHLVAEALARHDLGNGQVKIVLITNAALLHRPAVAEALAYLDQHHGEIWAKLDAGTEAYYRTIDVSRVPFARILTNIRDAGRARPLVIQSMFLRFNGAGPSDEELSAFVGRLKDLAADGCGIRRVQVYTVARRAALPGVEPLGDVDIDAIVRRVREAGFVAEGYYGAR